MEHLTLGVFRIGETYFVRAESALGEAGPYEIDSMVIAESVIKEKNLLSNQPNLARAQVLGRRLFGALFRGDIEKLYQQTLAVAHSQKSALNILFKFKQSPELHEVAWELLHDGEKFLATDPAIPIARYIEQMQPIKDLPVKPPLRMLFTTAVPNDYEPLDLAREERNIRRALVDLDDKIELVVERNISLDKLRHTLTRAGHIEQPFHIWHHCGHGAQPQDNKFFVLVLRDRDGSSQPVETEQLRTLLRPFSTLRVATLNVCRGASRYGLAPSLAALNVPAVVGFRGDVFDDTALTFAKAFYESLLHTSVTVAMSHARVALAVEHRNSIEWAMPLLFLRTNNPFLLTKEITDAKPTVKKTKSSIQIETKRMRAKRVVNVGKLNVGEPRPNAESDTPIKIKTGEMEAEEISQIGELNLADTETAKQFDFIRQLARSISGLAADE